MGRDAALNYTVGYVVATYSVNISVTGSAGDKIQFKMRRTGGTVPWRLNPPPATNPNVAYKTSMFFGGCRTTEKRSTYFKTKHNRKTLNKV